jgi:hypothetical protein
VLTAVNLSAFALVGTGEKSARIANAAAARGKPSVGRKGGQSGSYEDWSVPELKKRAKEIGLSGYSVLNKRQLVSKLRNS